MSTTVPLEVRLADARRAIEKSQPNQAGKGEQFLNKTGRLTWPYFLWPSLPFARYSSLVLGDRAQAVSGSGAALATKDVAASAAFNVVKEQVSHFVENSKVLVDLLDEVGKVHPIIQGMSLLSSLISLLSYRWRILRRCCVCVQGSDSSGARPTRERSKAHYVECDDV